MVIMVIAVLTVTLLLQAYCFFPTLITAEKVRSQEVTSQMIVEFYVII